ncbi:hypothetical protein LINGRAHAP2_LOCUS7378 [Linum grandiflorum]
MTFQKQNQPVIAIRFRSSMFSPYRLPGINGFTTLTARGFASFSHWKISNGNGYTRTRR